MGVSIVLYIVINDLGSQTTGRCPNDNYHHKLVNVWLELWLDYLGGLCSVHVYTHPLWLLGRRKRRLRIKCYTYHDINAKWVDHLTAQQLKMVCGCIYFFYKGRKLLIVKHDCIYR